MRLTFALLVVLGSGSAWAQQVISAHAGMIHYVEGDVTIDGTTVHPKFAEFPDVKNDQVLATGEGRAEVLLTPGVFLRLAENSSVRMISNALTDTRIEVVSGSVLVEAGELLPDNAVTFEMRGTRLAIPKRGVYRIDAAASRVSIFDGQAVITAGTGKITAKKGQQVAITDGNLSAQKFDVKSTDAFYRWNARRAGYIAAANLTSARVAANSDYRSSFGGRSGAWNWNPWFGMYTYMPASGVYWSPFGPAFYSPGMISTLYIHPRDFAGYGGGRGAAAPPVSAPPSFPVGPPMMSGPRGGGGMPGGGFSGGGAPAQVGPPPMAGPRGR